MKKIIVISNTVGREFSQSIKTTAVRYFKDFEVISLLTSHECDYSRLIKKISKVSKNIFVDLEKKQPLNLGNPLDQGGNLYNNILRSIRDENLSEQVNLYPIKLNDITVDATWKLLNSIYSDISGLSLGIVGTGNIGSKIISCLTESGTRLKCYNRDINKAISIINSILLTKPEQVIESPNIVRRIEHTISNTSGLIVACSELNIDLADYIHLMKKDFSIYLIGHSILKEESLTKFRNKGVSIRRVDVGKELLGYIIGTLFASEYNVYGKKSIGKNNNCSGGYIGSKNDLIVDDFNNPSWFYGCCNGKGGVDYDNTNDLYKSLDEIDKFFN